LRRIDCEVLKEMSEVDPSQDLVGQSDLDRQSSMGPKLMHRATRLLFAFLLGTGSATMQPATRLVAMTAPVPSATAETPEGSSEQAHKARLRPVAAKAPDIPFSNYDVETEQQLFTLANQSRKQAGAPLLVLNTGLSEAARIHAEAMVAAHQLSHQFNGEPSLSTRLADISHLHLDQEGENVALDSDAQHGHEHLMLSPQHRANLLNPAYNVAGLGVVRSGDQLYIVQVFGHAIPSYTVPEVKDRIAAAVNLSRSQAGQKDLQRHDLQTADAAACSMAQAGKLSASSLSATQGSTVLTYTSLHPELLPGGTGRVIAGRPQSTFSVGTCFARTDNYPAGVYWVVLSLE
jgi:uncharacterized protein YkwD